MNRLARIISLCLVLALTLTIVGVAGAQDQELPGAGEGGIIIEGNQRGSGNLGPLVPIRCSGVDCSNPNALMWPGLIGINPENSAIEVGVDGNLVTSYEISEDGLTYTLSLRDDMVWNDGTPITAVDAYFAWDAVANHYEEAGISSSYSDVKDFIVGAEIIDDYTISFTFEAPNCTAINTIASVSPVPAHGYGYVVGEDFDFTSMVNHPFDTQPTITAGPFKFTRTEPGTAVYLEADQTYVDAIDGFVRPEGYVYLDVPDENVMVERFLTFNPGEPNYVREPDGNLIPTILASEAQALNAPGRLWHYVALNHADPANPQNGQDEDGNLIDQGQHPIFGDVRVRQALQHAINIDDIVNGPLNGNGTPMVAGTIPTAFSIHPDLERRAFDLETAAALLDEAGWTDADGNGTRECNGCATAEEGTELRFSMMNVGDIRGDVAVILQDQFAQVGVAVDVEVVDFNTMYDTNMGAQIYDSAVAGWRGGLPFDPDQRAFFGSDNDIADVTGEGAYGFNFPSYQNARVDELFDIITFGSCDQAEILEAAYEVQEILWEEQPYLWLYAFNSLYATAPNVANFAPYPNFGNWNMDQWAVVE